MFPLLKTTKPPFFSGYLPQKTHNPKTSFFFQMPYLDWSVARFERGINSWINSTALWAPPLSRISSLSAWERHLYERRLVPNIVSLGDFWNDTKKQKKTPNINNVFFWRRQEMTIKIMCGQLFLLRFFFYLESERRGAEGGVVKDWVIFEIYVF